MSFRSPTPRQAVLELIFAAALWGFGFVATQWALTSWNPQGILLWRFAGAVLLGEILYLLFKPKSSASFAWLKDFYLALPAGLVLGLFLLLQTIGLQYTSASKSGFITTLYVILVPALNFLFFKKKSPPSVVLMAGVACLGTFLLMGLNAAALQEQLNQGDLWTLASAVLAAVHIIYIGRISSKVHNAFRLNTFQSFWAMIAIVPFVFLDFQTQPQTLNSKALLGLLILAIGSSVLAFFIQIRAQKVLSDTTASVLFLLESPYAFFFAFLLMGDRLDIFQSAGALLILGSAVGTVLLEQSGSTNTAPAG